MTIKRNLCPNPACANNSTGWTPTPAGSYVRSTSVDAGLPRTTGLEGTVVADINSPRYLVTAGDQIVVSVSVKALGAQSSVGLICNFYDAASGGTFVSAAATVYMNLAAGEVQRYVIGPITVPAGAVSGHLKFNDIDTGGVEISGLRACVSTGDLTDDGTYYDGASAGWAWDGTAGSSTSAARVVSDTVTLTDSFSKNVTVDANTKVWADTVATTETVSINASGTVQDTFYAIDGFLVASLAFDDARGRVRLSAYTFAPEVTHAIIWRRVPGGKYTQIRGGNIPIINGQFSRIADDYEYDSGLDNEYLIEGLTDTNVVVQRAIVVRSGADDVPWLKIVAAPRFNTKIRIVDWENFKRNARSAEHRVLGRPDPVFTNDIHSSRQTTVELYAVNPAETNALDLALSRGLPAFIQMPAGNDFPSMYVSIGSYDYGNPKRKNTGRSVFSVPITEISPPASSIMSALATYQTIIDSNSTYNDLLVNYETYEMMAS